MNDGRIALAQQFPGLRFLDDSTATLTVLAASNEGGKVVAKGDDGRLRIRSLVSTPRVNCYGFRIALTAWPSAMREFMENPVMLAHHDPEQPIGRWTSWEVRPEGLVMEGWISAGEPMLQEKVLDGTLARTSVGFLPLSMPKDEDNIPVVEALSCKEISLLALPGDRGTMVEPLKAPEPAPAAPALAVVERERVQDEDHEVVALGVADACRATLGALSSLGQAGRIAAGLRRVSIQRGGE